MADNSDKKCSIEKVTLFDDARVEINMWYLSAGQSYGCDKRKFQLLRQEVKELEDFLHAHCSWKHIHLTIVAPNTNICSHCKKPWDNDNGRCGNCGAVLDEKEE